MKRLDWKDFKAYADKKGIPFTLEREANNYAYFVLVDGPIAYSTRVSYDRPEYQVMITEAKNSPVTTKITGVSESEGMHARFKGLFNFEINPGEEVTSDYTLDKDYIFDGVMYQAICNWSDSVSFHVVHPVYGVLDNFATNFYVTSEPVTLRIYKANLQKGLILRVVYKNSGSDVAKFKANFFLHEKI